MISQMSDPITYMADALDVPTCTGGCGLSTTKHRTGTIDPFGVIHYAERRWTKRSARNYLLLVARQRREADEGYLNIDLYDWYYLYSDARDATRMAHALGFVIPSYLWDDRRILCRLLATKRGVRLSKYKKVYDWSRT